MRLYSTILIIVTILILLTANERMYLYNLSKNVEEIQILGLTATCDIYTGKRSYHYFIFEKFSPPKIKAFSSCM